MLHPQATAASVIEISYCSESPEDAARIANALAQAYQAQCNAIQPAASVSNALYADIIENAAPNLRAYYPNKPLRIALGLWSGLWIAFLAAAGVFWVCLRFGKKPEAQSVSPTHESPFGESPRRF